MAERHNRLFFVGSEGRCVCVGVAGDGGEGGPGRGGTGDGGLQFTRR